MFQFPYLPPSGLCVQPAVSEVYSEGLPYSDIPGSKLARQLTEAYRSLATSFFGLLTPRHPPHALNRLTCIVSEIIYLSPRHYFLISCLLYSIPRGNGSHAVGTLRDGSADVAIHADVYLPLSSIQLAYLANPASSLPEFASVKKATNLRWSRPVLVDVSSFLREGERVHNAKTEIFGGEQDTNGRASPTWSQA